MTIVTFGPALYTAITVAGVLQERFGLSAAVVDLRAANPLNYDPLVTSVRKTGKVLLLTNAVERSCVMQTICGEPDAALLRRPGRAARGGGIAQRITPAAELETLFFPQPSWLLDAIHERILLGI